MTNFPAVSTCLIPELATVLGFNALGEAGVAIDGAIWYSDWAEWFADQRNVLQGTGITSTAGSGVFVNTLDGESNNDYGLRGRSVPGDGVFGWSEGIDDTDNGISGRGEDGYGVYGSSWSSPYGLYTPDDLYVGGGCNGCTLSYVSYNASSMILQPGDTVSTVGVSVSRRDGDTGDECCFGSSWRHYHVVGYSGWRSDVYRRRWRRRCSTRRTFWRSRWKCCAR